MRSIAGFLAVSIALTCSVLPGFAEELTVSAAVSLKEAFWEIGRVFDSTHPGVKVVFNFGATGQLAQQIERGAPVDVFAAAAMDQAMKLQSNHLLDRLGVRPFAANHLVVVVPSGQKPVANLQDLLGLQLIAMGNPQTVPAGQYARNALVKAGVYQKLLSVKKIVYGESVRQTLDYVEHGDVDAGLVYATDARIGKNITTSYDVPEEYTGPIIYPIAVMADSKHKTLAEQFVELVRSKQGQSVLKSRGFLSITK